MTGKREDELATGDNQNGSEQTRPPLEAFFAENRQELDPLEKYPEELRDEELEGLLLNLSDDNRAFRGILQSLEMPIRIARAAQTLSGPIAAIADMYERLTPLSQPTIGGLVKALESQHDTVAQLAGEFVMSEHAQEIAAFLRDNADQIAEILEQERLKAEKEEGQKKELRGPLPLMETFGFQTGHQNRQAVSGRGLVKEELTGQVRWFGVSQLNPDAKSAPVYGQLALTYNGPNKDLNKAFSAFDGAVYDSISTAWYYHVKNNQTGPLILTPKEIWDALNGRVNGKEKGPYPSPQQLERVRDSVNKMRNTTLYLNISSELEAGNYSFSDGDRVVNGVIEEHLLLGSWGSFTTEKGKIYEGFHFYKEPVFFWYNRVKGQVSFIPSKMLNVSGSTGIDGYTIEFTHYLAEQVSLLQQGKRHSSRFYMRTIYAATGITPPEDRSAPEDHKSPEAYRAVCRQRAKKDRDKVEAILTDWKNRQMIDEFSRLKEGNTITGFEIKMQPRRRAKTRGPKSRRK